SLHGLGCEQQPDRQEAQMQHRPRLTPFGRLLLVQRVTELGWVPTTAAEALGVSRATAYKRLRRYRESGEPGLVDRSSRPSPCPHALAASTVARTRAMSGRCGSA